MKFTYSAKAEIDRQCDNNEDITSWESFESSFTNADPFIAREAAFRRAKAYEDIFKQADLEKTDNFFRSDRGWYNEYDISVFFNDPKTGEEIQLHNSKSIHINRTALEGRETYDPIQMRWILRDLQREFDILGSCNIPIKKAKSIELLIKPKNERQAFTVFPTPFIGTGNITIEDIEL